MIADMDVQDSSEPTFANVVFWSIYPALYETPEWMN